MKIFSFTGIGSVPFKSFEDALPILEIFFEEDGIPFWPQLPKRSPLENMYAQFFEGYPGGIVKNGDVYVDPDAFEKEIEPFYEKFVSGNLEGFRISQERAEGFYAMLDYIHRNGISPPVFKIQVTGPISFGLVLKEVGTGRQAIYSERYFEPLIHLINRKILWQIDMVKSVLPNSKILIFLDEPYMMSWGSAFFNFPEEGVIYAFKEALEGVEGIKGVHCCGNTDWGLMLSAGLDLVNFDAFSYMENFLLYREKILSFLDGGGTVAWGIVPTDERVRNTSPDGLLGLLSKGFKVLGMNKKTPEGSHILTPSCGTGSMTEEDATKVFKILRELQKKVRKGL